MSDKIIRKQISISQGDLEILETWEELSSDTYEGALVNGIIKQIKENKMTMKTHSNNITNLEGAKEKPTLKELQKMVGGNIEVAFSDEGLGVQIIVDEEGKLKGKGINMGATEHWWELLRLDTPPEEFHTLEEFINKVDFLVGHVVFLHGGARLD